MNKGMPLKEFIAELESTTEGKEAMDKGREWVQETFYPDRVAKHLHYPECWDTAAYPTLKDAISAIGHSKCTNDECEQVKNVIERIEHAVRILSSVTTFEGRKAMRILENLLEDMEK
jgi:hypothetical protein